MNLNNVYIAAAIVFAGVLIAGAIVFGGGRSMITTAVGFENSNSETAANIRPVDGTDHIRGGKDAKVTIIEYSDFECPFCSQFHPTLSRIIDDFGGEVAWVYRHFPLTSLHSRANAAAIASECVAELGGNDAFWSFADEMFINQRSLGTELYTRVAGDLGIDAQTFETCLKSPEHKERVQKDLDNAILSGGRGTPFSVIVNEKGETFPFAGALRYETVRNIIEQALKS